MEVAETQRHLRLGEALHEPAGRRREAVAFRIPSPRSRRSEAVAPPAHPSPPPAVVSVTISPVKERILKKFEDEIQQLDKELKTELPREIKRARELGDLRENAEYQAAKERQRLVESRISLLQKRVSEIQLMNLDRIPKDKVGFGSTVTLSEDNGQTVVYQLVMPEDANVDEGLISTASPIGRALLNKEEGDDVLVKTPNGAERRFEITKLVTIHD
jgi:transcription elongation factor GreA